MNKPARKKSRRLPGSRRYHDYSQEDLEKCLDDVRSGIRSQRAAADYYGIPRSTIKNKLKGAHAKTPGRQPVLTMNEEKSIVEHVKLLCDFGFPITEYELRWVVKTYLDKTGRKVPEFRSNDNLPGYDWGRFFLQRNSDLSPRLCANIKRDRAGIDEESIKKYFENLKKSVDGIPPSNIWNFDETNLSDDPGSKKVLSRRGIKHVEQIVNSSKTSTSIMFCGNAEGMLLPPYVVYKAERLWDTWTEGGPKGTHYNRSKSGWFDSGIFEDWFFRLLLPRVQKQDGKKLLIGDNLPSHLNGSILKACQENDILFVCLPPSSTHLTQPLDVAYFHPLKKAWREILQAWRKTAEGERMKTLPKDAFPRLLRKLVDDCLVDKGQNLISGFKACGIYPYNEDEVLKKLPTENSVNVDIVGEAFLEAVISKRAVNVVPQTQKRRKRLNVEPGKSICPDDISVNLNVGILSAPGTSTPNETVKRKRKVGRPRKGYSASDTTSTSSESDYTIHDEMSDNFNFDSEDENVDSNTATVTIQSPPVSQLPIQDSWKMQLRENDYVAVNYNGELYPGKIISFIEDDDSLAPRVKCMEKTMKFWRWPSDREDILAYSWDDIKKKNTRAKTDQKGVLFSFRIGEFHLG